MGGLPEGSRLFGVRPGSVAQKFGHWKARARARHGRGTLEEATKLILLIHIRQCHGRRIAGSRNPLRLRVLEVRILLGAIRMRIIISLVGDLCLTCVGLVLPAWGWGGV